MNIDSTIRWIAFVQNEFPCDDGEYGCVETFKRESVKFTGGIVFKVTASKEYATAHGRDAGATGVVWFVRGNMTYQAPPLAPSIEDLG
jgi:hypothetical protein